MNAHLAWAEAQRARFKAPQHEPVPDNRGNLCVECGEVIGGPHPSTWRPEYCRRCAGDSLGERYDHGPDDTIYRGDEGED